MVDPAPSALDKEESPAPYPSSSVEQGVTYTHAIRETVYADCYLIANYRN
jgi:hypothetical protein